MGRKKAEANQPVQPSVYTIRRLEQLAESQLAPKAIEIKGGRLKDNMFCHYEYDHTVAANTTDSIKRASQVPVHDDMINSFRDLNVHLALICEEIRPEEIQDIDNLPEMKKDTEDQDQDPLALKLSKFSVSAFKVVGNGENEGVVLIGQKVLSTLESVKLETPPVKWQSSYHFANELHVAVFNVVEEIEQYMNGKQAPPRQQELDFGAEGANGTGEGEEEVDF